MIYLRISTCNHFFSFLNYSLTCRMAVLTFEWTSIVKKTHWWFWWPWIELYFNIIDIRVSHWCPGSCPQSNVILFVCLLRNWPQSQGFHYRGVCHHSTLVEYINWGYASTVSGQEINGVQHSTATWIDTVGNSHCGCLILEIVDKSNYFIWIWKCSHSYH